MVRATSRNTGASGGIPLGAKEYFVGHAVLGGLLPFTGGFFARNSCVGVRLERAPGNAVKRERLVFRFRKFAWVNVGLNSDFAIAVGGAKKCVQQAGGTVGAQRHVLPVRTENTERTRVSVREAGEGGQLLAVNVEAELERGRL